MINQELIWSEPKIINTSFGICKEIKCNSSLGIITIEWEVSGVKNFSIEIDKEDGWIGVEFDLDSAKKMAMDYLIKHNIEPNNNLQFIQN